MRKHSMALGMAACTCLGATAMAQVAEKKTLTLDGAKTTPAACESEARKSGATRVIAVVGDGGNLMALHRIDGTYSAGASVSIGKARTVAMFKNATGVFEDNSSLLRASPLVYFGGRGIRTIRPGAAEAARTLYLAAQTGIYRIRLNVAGPLPSAPSIGGVAPGARKSDFRGSNHQKCVFDSTCYLRPSACVSLPEVP